MRLSPQGGVGDLGFHLSQSVHMRSFMHTSGWRGAGVRVGRLLKCSHPPLRSHVRNFVGASECVCVCVRVIVFLCSLLLCSALLSSIVLCVEVRRVSFFLFTLFAIRFL